MKPIPMPTESDIDRYTDEAYERRRDEDLNKNLQKTIKISQESYLV
jgi:hypothetical protein